MTYSIMVHYWIGETTNIDRFTCQEYESDIAAGVIRLKDGTDEQVGSVVAAQYTRPWRVLIREIS
jgi:hypothetical protein